MPPTPVAPNPSSSAKNGDFKSTARQTLLSLDARRQALEMEASAIIDELTREQEDGGIPMGIDTPLVDHDGYPRSDIDVYRARTLRKRLKEIKTDRASLMEQLEVGLVKVAAEEVCRVVVFVNFVFLHLLGEEDIFQICGNLWVHTIETV